MPVSFDDRQRQRLRRLAWHARYHATETEAEQIENLCAAVRLGQVSVLDAHQALSSLRAAQQKAA